jgi:formimidoylglutamate deiminase
VYYAHSNFGGLPPVAGQRRFINSVDGFGIIVDECRRAAASLDDANVGIAPHSLRAVTPDELQSILPLAQGGPVHIHAAEQTKEVDDCLAWSGQRPVEWLLEHANVDAHWCLVHATHLTPSEVEGLARSGAVAGLCAITEANLGDGTFSAEHYLRAGGRIGVGTDSNVLIDAAGELRAVEYAQRLSHRARNVLAEAEGRSTGRTLFDRALAGGAQALGIPASGLREGAAADIVSLDENDPSLSGRKGDAVLDSWIFAGASIDCVWGHGRKVVSGGRHHDRVGIRERSSRVIKRLME